jgi:prepilin-type N-terminal cleavage/methylation domain-containing protein
MSPTSSPRRRRPSFTLVELLVVIAIIGVLLSMGLALILRFRSRTTEAQTAVEITQLANAAGNFKAKFKVNPPSLLLMSNNRRDYDQKGDQLDLLRAQSLAWITRLWPDLDWNSGIDWSGGSNPNYGWTLLQGDACLVFFLGGIPSPDGGVTGFSTDKRNPTRPGGDRIGPFFTFDSSRLYSRGGSPFPSYRDPWETGMPYVLFSSGKKCNSYNDGDVIVNVNGDQITLFWTIDT